MGQELAGLRRRVAQLKEDARKNEEAWKRAQRLEMHLLESDDLTTLLTRATDGVRAGYRLEAATLVVVDEDHEIRHLLMSEGAEPDAFAAIVFVDSMPGLLPFDAETPRPWLGAYSSFAHASLFPQGERLGSIALLPLARRERLFGSLNMGSADAARFTRLHAADFLQHLGVIAAFALENTANRARLVRSGLTDPLTGWSNRRYLEARLREEVARCRRERLPLACLMIDVDHFKTVNDRHGHLAGDEVLRGLARRLGTEVRGSDVAARYGGEEFVILLPGTDMLAASSLAERIRAIVAARPFEIGGGPEPLGVTVSIGVAESPPEALADCDGGSMELLARADAALYEAKARGRNMVVLRNYG
jgi:two-component system, cell cycle response regulator